MVREIKKFKHYHQFIHEIPIKEFMTISSSDDKNDNQIQTHTRIFFHILHLTQMRQEEEGK